MKAFLKLNFFITLLILLSGCVEKEGYYDYNQKNILSKLSGNKWERKYHDKLDNGTEMDIHEIYLFNENGNGSFQSTTTYMNGKIENNTSYFHWSFITPDFRYIYMDYPLFWEIEEITKDKLSIIETYKDPINEPNQNYRDFQQFTPIKK